MRKIGDKKEATALKFLQHKGLKLITKNFNTKMGEIDIIMTDKSQIIFVEVRYRRSNSHGGAAESISFSKQKKIIRTSLYYLQTKGLYEKVPFRFDIIAIDDDPVCPIEWIQNAF